MNQILIRQNEPKQIEKLAAQRELYSLAKQWQIAQLILSIGVSVGLGAWSLIDPKMADTAAVWGGLIALADTLLFDRLIASFREKAAKVQEQFDCYVLDFSCSPLKNPEDITDQEIATYHTKHKYVHGNIDKLIDWYPTSVAALPLHLARLVCQRSNCSWDAELRRRYANLAAKILFGLLMFLLVLGLSLRQDLTAFLLMMCTWCPFLVYCIRQYNDQIEASKRKKELVIHAQNLWANGFNKGERTLKEYSRQLQNDIYDARRKDPAVLDIFYHRLKDEQENAMNRTAEELVHEALSKIATTSNQSF